MADQLLRVSIHGSGSSLQGVGRLPDGRAVFVDGALPGEVVDIAVTRDAGRYAVARLAGVVSPSAQRQEPFCPHYASCGGCACQHMRYVETLRLKGKVVEDALRRIGGQEEIEVSPCLGMERPFRWRNKVEYAVDRQGRLGFAQSGSHVLVPVTDCPLAEEHIPEAAKAVEEWLRGRSDLPRWVVLRQTASGEVMLILSYDGPVKSAVDGLWECLPASVRSVHICRLRPRFHHALDGELRLVCGAPSLVERLAGMDFSMSPQSFFQVDRRQAERMLQMAVDAVPGGEGGLAADVYCGVGTFSLTLARARAWEAVLGFEIVPKAVEDARANAAAAGLADRTAFYAGDAATTLPARLRGRTLAFALLDPPRSGAEEPVLRAICASEPSRILYVSCDPATLARDVRRLAPAYVVTSVQPVDMFPWSHHVECVTLLTRTETVPEVWL